MKLAVIGSRSFKDYDLLKACLKGLAISEIVSGGAAGADRLAERYAAEHKIPIRVFTANWEKFGRAAGPIRNKEIVDYADKVIAFWDGRSPGTRRSIRLAERAGKLLAVNAICDDKKAHPYVHAGF
jgi:hypothetical protein